ncbi:MAG TPA: hypothetical protein VHD32_13575 [Candidatus Didemnitutus sp.]|nr:hypothetical protein [Candidatus Didemnitutus sp.]
MQIDDLRTIVRGLPIGAPDLRDDVDSQSTALGAYTGKISRGITKPAVGMQPSDWGAAILVLIAIAEGQGLSIEEAILAGKEELARIEED